MTKQEIAKKVVAKEIKLNPTLIKAEGLTEKDVKEIQKMIKELKAKKRDEAFKANHCTIEYKGKVMAFTPKKLEGYDIIVFKAFDKNGVLYCVEGEKGEVVADVITCCSKKSREYTLRQSQINKTKKQDTELLTSATTNMTFKHFMELCAGFKGYSEIKVTGVLKNIIG